MLKFLIEQLNKPWAGVVPAFVYLAIFFAVPLGYLVIVSFWTLSPQGFEILPDWTLRNYHQFFNTKVNMIGYVRSIYITIISVSIGVIFGYVFAYTLAFIVPKRFRLLGLLIVVLPFWTSFIVRAFSWQLFLNETGPIASLLRSIGVLSGNLGVVDTHVGTVIALSLFSLMIVTVSVYTVIESIPRNLLEAARDLGGTERLVFKEVILPLSWPGLSVAMALSFIICFGDYVAPTLLGGGLNLVFAQLMVGSLLENFNVPMAATYAVFLLLTILLITLPIILLGRRKY